MSGKDSKRSKARRKLYTPASAPSWPSATAFSGAPSAPFQPFGNGVTMNVNEVATEFGLTVKSTNADAERITALMDAPVDLDIAAHAISRGPNPYLDRCMHCSALRPDTQEGDEGLELLDLQLDGNTVISNMDNPQPLSSFKLEIWTCAECRTAAKNFQSFLAYDLPLVNDKEMVDPLSLPKPKEEKESCEREELRENWVELRSLVKELYCCEEESGLPPEQENHLKYLIDKLCRIDPHQLFLGLEDKVREIVSDMKTSLLTKLKENGYDKPELALDFTSSLLSHYDRLTHKAHILAQYLGGLSSHLKRFEVTWELLNKHLFHSVAHNDHAISNSGPTILEQLRQGSVQYERSKDDPYCSVRKRLLKFQEEMSVVVVVWRDCQQLIENYCHEEVKNTHKHLSSKTRSFIYHQRQLLKDHLLRDPFSGEALSETMKNLMATHKSSMERIMCHRCKRERCTCDECTITHRITCGIINSDMSGEHAPNSFNFALDHTRNVMDITPPSMSSTTSSSGSVSPINIEDKLTTFYDHREEFSDTLLNCEDREGTAPSMNGDGNFENCDDDEADDEDEGDEDEYGEVQDAGGDEPHSLQDPAFLWEAMQEHQREQLRQQHVYLERLNHHNCNHRHNHGKSEHCPFQPPINPKLSRELDAELAKSGLLPKGAGDFANGDLTLDASGVGAESKGGGGGDSNGGLVNPALCATCQCHACLKQSGHVVSTSLPLQVSASPSPADLHLYPHIHGLPQQDPKSYMLDLPHFMSSIKLPVKIDFDDPAALQDHFYHAYSDWDSPMQPRPGSLAAQHQHHQRLSGHSSDLLPPPPIDPAAPSFTFDLASHLATHTTHTSTTNTTSAFKSVTGKHFASSVMPTLSNMGNITSEGSSVDPTKPLDFASLAKIPQSCLNGTGAFPAPSFSPSSTTSCMSMSCGPLSSSVSGASVTSSSTNAKPNGLCQGPPCSRPTPLGGNATTSKWEKGRPQHCKKFTGGAHLKLPPGSSGHQHQHVQPGQQAPEHNMCIGPPGHPHPPTQPFKNVPPGPHQHKQDGRGRACLVPPTPAARPGGLADGVPISPSPLPSADGMVNNIGVGMSAPCSDPECEVHHGEENCDSVDDSCSEKSSTTSNQKEGKYCDCHYCEFFGHSATTAKTSTNYNETKNRLRQKLKKRQDEGKDKPGSEMNGVRQDEDGVDKRGIDDIVKFIMGPDEERKAKEKEISAKAAKRARQKQKKLEEQAKSAESMNSTELQDAVRCLYENTSHSCEGFDAQLHQNGTKSKLKKQSVNVQKQKVQSDKLHHTTETAMKQEINRKSLIIESTRPTISLPKKDADKRAHSSQIAPVVSNSSSKESSQNNNFLGALQSLGKQGMAPASSTTTGSFASTTQPNGNVASSKMSAVSKSSGKENMKTSAASCQQHQRDKPRHQQQQQQHWVNPHQGHTTAPQPNNPQPAQPQRGQRQQQASNKTVNGKMSAQSQQSASKGPTPNTAPPSNHTAFSGKAQPARPASSNGAPLSSRLVNGHCEGGNGKALSGSLPTSTAAAASSTVASPAVKSSSVMDSPGTGSGSSASQSPSCGTKAVVDQGKPNGKAKKKKKNKNGGINCFDEIFMPKSESELDADVDDFERELEEFKRFCFEPAEPKERRKIPVNVNLKDIFKKKTGLV